MNQLEARNLLKQWGSLAERMFAEIDRESQWVETEPTPQEMAEAEAEREYLFGCMVALRKESRL